MTTECTHLDAIEIDMPAESDKRGAERTACVAEGTDWVHLRKCLVCGHVLCCDSSPTQHMSHHAAAESHPIVTSMQPGEAWRWAPAIPEGFRPRGAPEEGAAARA